MILCLDTITENAGITLVAKDSAIYLALDPKNSSDGIIETIDKALKKSGALLADLNGVLAIKGPGSFTGLRVGLTVANQFAHQLKIPIIGLRTDEWWLARTEENDAIYLQTMNMAEVYLASSEINSIEDVQSLKKFGPAKWLGQLSGDQIAWLPSDFEAVKDLLPVAETWQKIAKNSLNIDVPQKTYDLVEPFYGKEPNITKSKKQLSVN